MLKISRLFTRGLLASLLLIATASPPAFADDVDGGLDDVLGGFDEGEPEDALDGFDDEDGGGEDDVFGGFDDDFEASGGDDSAPPLDRLWEITGSLSLGGSVNYLAHEAFKGPGETTDYTGLQRLRSRLNLQVDFGLPMDWKLRIAGFAFYDWAYLLNGRNEYSDEVLDLYEWEVDFQEFYLQGSPLDDLDLKVGRQVVNWGRSDSLQVLDVLNPLDNREPGLTDIEDIRRPTSMIKADYYLGDWSLSLIAIPELRFDLIPVVGNDFAPVTESIGTAGFFVAPQWEPKVSFKNTEWAVRLMGIFSGWDISFHYANHWLNSPYLDPVINVILRPPPDLPDVSFEGTKTRYSRVQIAGTGANYTIGSWLLKTEFAWIDGTHYTTSEEFDLSALGLDLGVVDVPTGTVRKDRLDFMAGVEYYGFNNTNIAIEIVNRHILDYQRNMRPIFGVRENQVETALRITRSFMNERLDVTLLGIIFGTKAQDGSIVRAEARYDVMDGIEIGLGMVFYQKGETPLFSNIARNDRIFFEVKYSF
ncbi:MAG: hypothetical protein JRG80_04550 [Deltaproteobacteria bacterium]|nr:hypothetical protein [Deltaproteobacteria bacterium]